MTLNILKSLKNLNCLYCSLTFTILLAFPSFFLSFILVFISMTKPQNTGKKKTEHNDGQWWGVISSTNQCETREITFTSVSSVGLVNIGRIWIESKETAPVWLVLSFLALIQPSSILYSPSFMIYSTSPLLKLRNVGSSEGKKKSER